MFSKAACYIYPMFSIDLFLLQIVIHLNCPPQWILKDQTKWKTVSNTMLTFEVIMFATYKKGFYVCHDTCKHS